MPIKELHVAGYRSIRELRLRLKNLNVLTGPNGCGKSNLYNSVFLLAKTASGGFARVIAEEGGMASVFWAGPREPRSRASARSQPVRVVLGVNTDSFSYELACGLPQQPPHSPTAFKLDPEVKEERPGAPPYAVFVGWGFSFKELPHPSQSRAWMGHPARKLAVRLYWMLRTNTAYPEIVRIESSSRLALVGAS